jgi:hypothetical protein
MEGNEQTVNLRWSAFREFLGGLILHGQDDMSKTYYGIHT